MRKMKGMFGDLPSKEDLDKIAEPHFALCPWWNGGECDCEQRAKDVLHRFE